MIKLFTSVVNMSITASFAVAAVIVIRLCLKKVPRIFSYLLWIPVLIRFLVPVSFEAGFGIIPDISLVKSNTGHVSGVTFHEYIPRETTVGEEKSVEKDPLSEEEIQYLPSERINTEAAYIYDTEDTEYRIADFGISGRIMQILGIIWILAGSALILYEIISYGIFMQRLRKESGSAMKEKGLQLWISGAVKTPFVTGLFGPVVYLPADLETGQKELILEHEKVHIRRLDYMIKPIGLLACCVNWFNPFAWLAYCLMEHDMESSCDEAVLRKIGYERKKEYADTLLGLAAKETWKVRQHIAFGESSVKSRIKHAVKMKKSSAIVTAAGAVIAVAAVFLLLVNRTEAVEDTGNPGFDRANIEKISENGEIHKIEDMHEVQDIISEKIAEKGTNGVPGTDTNDLSETEFSSPDGYVRKANYVPSRDQFEIILLTSTQDHEDIAILYSYPVEYSRISDTFGIRVNPITMDELMHSGIDFVADKGTPIKAAADGIVAENGYDPDCGNYIILQHSNGEMTYYASCDTILAEEGKNVKRGETIATVGSTGMSTGSHLHFAVSRDGNYIEPQFVENEGEP